MTAWVLSDGKIGDEAQCFGIAEALGLSPERRLIAPRAPWRWLAPHSRISRRDAPDRAQSPIAPPFPDILFAAGRQTVPYLRRVREDSRGKTFTVFVKDPYTGPATADVIWVPAHDSLCGANVIVTTTPANRVGRALDELRRASPDPRIAALPHPRIALILGGNSVNHRFAPRDCARLIEIACELVRDGRGVMISPSRRSPPALLAQLIALFAEEPRVFVWDGRGDNPYAQMLAHADQIIVTGDSVNMVGEAVATGAPVHVYEPSGGHRKITAYVDRLTELGAVRRWNGRLDSWRYAPIDATPIIAREVAARYLQAGRAAKIASKF
ncbi:MAG: mitochondrial fission ELM1 family protein [Methylobacteriaceae bacterium]|nr:mitochondrial fission ELM1 family protein [Methylobacteriaceae bacterium]